MGFDIGGITLDTYHFPYLHGIKPFSHQALLYQAVQDAINKKETVCIFNLAPTGAGKTMASFAFPLLNQDRNIKCIGVYPTNELLKDQKRAIDRIAQENNYKAGEIYTIDGESLLKLRAVYGKSRNLDVLTQLFNHWGRIILTNPDILFMLFFNSYPQAGGIVNKSQLAQIMQRIMAEYQIVVFDEFHIYNIKQMNDVALLVGATAAISKDQPHIFIFSSATPSGSFLEMLGRLGIPLIQIDGANLFGHVPAGQRTVLRPARLQLVPCNLLAWEGVEKVMENYGLVERYLTEYPAAKVLVILDSVYEARALAEFLVQEKNVAPEEVGEVHGFMDSQARLGGLSRKFTVGTSTIEVGIDFAGENNKDLLIFEARSSSQFLQRFGRLARGEGKEGSPVPMTIALVPAYVYNYVNQDQESSTDGERSREHLAETIQEAYYEFETFPRFVKEYGHLSACFLVDQLLYQQFSDTKKDVMSKLSAMLETLYGKSYDLAKPLYDYHRPLLAPLLTFRGSNFLERFDSDKNAISLKTAVYDRTDRQRGMFPFKIYDLPFVLRRARGRLVAAKQFNNYFDEYVATIAEQDKLYADQFSKRLKREKPPFFIIVDGLIKGKPRQLVFNASARYGNSLGQLLRIKDGLKIISITDLDMDLVNDKLRGMSAVAWISKEGKSQIAKNWRLPPLFRLYDLTFGAANFKHGLAFDLDAYFMSTLMTYSGPAFA